MNMYFMANNDESILNLNGNPVVIFRVFYPGLDGYPIPGDSLKRDSQNKTKF